MRKPRGRANAVDAHVGGRIRTRRTLLGLNQTQLGEALGLTFQQVQKYEKGSNRVGASRLYQLSKVLDVPIAYFFEDMPDELKQLTPPTTLPSQDDDELGAMEKRETLELIRAYYRIDNAIVRDRLRETIRAIAGESRRTHVR